MTSDGHVVCMCGCAVTLLLLLLVMPMWAEHHDLVGIGSVKHSVRRHIRGSEPLTVDKVNFAKVREEADKHVETFVENVEFSVNISGSNASNFVLNLKTYVPPSEESTSTTQEQLQQSTTTQQQTQVHESPGYHPLELRSLEQYLGLLTLQQPQVQQLPGQLPQVQQLPGQLSQVQQLPRQFSEVQQLPGQLSQVQQLPGQFSEVQQTSAQKKSQQRKQLTQKPPGQKQQNQPHKQQQQQKPQQPPHQRRRHHRKTRENQAVGERRMGALDIADVAFGGVGRQAEDKRQSRQQQAQRNDATFDRYFHKKTIDDYFRKSSDEKTEEDKEELRERRYKGVPNGIETDVTMVEEIPPGAFGMEMERDLMQRDVDASDLINPEKDGSLTLNKLSSVLNSNESIEHLQLFSDNPSSSVRWDEPAMMSNCWLHKMLANRYTFSPSCQPDGTYYNKQCYLERCWCVDNEGRPRDRKFVTRFAYKKYGSLLYCTPQLHSVVAGNLLQPPETDFEPVVHTEPPSTQNPAKLVRVSSSSVPKTELDEE